MRKKVLTIILIIMICAISLISYAEDLNETNTNLINNTTDLNQLTEKRNEIQNQIDESNKHMQDVDEELSANLQQIEKIDQNIESTKQSLNELNNNIEEITNNIKEINKQLKIITDKYNKQRGILEQRLVAKYEQGKITYLDFLLNSKNLTQFISSCYLISELTEYDNDLLEIVEEEKNEVEDKQKKLEVQEKSLEDKRQVQIKTETVLENSKILRETYIAKLNEEEQLIQTQIDEFYNQINIVEEEIRGLAKIESFGPDYIGGSMIWPIPGYNTITSNYGMRTHPITGVYKLHTGVDIGAPIGADFVATAYGIVVKAEYNTAYGNMVIIDHGGGVQTLYAHGSQIEVKLGQVVNAGDIVLKVGQTGYATGPHAHFEVRVNGDALDPLQYVNIPEEQ